METKYTQTDTNGSRSLMLTEDKSKPVSPHTHAVMLWGLLFQVECSEEESQLVLERNPLEWSVDEVVSFITSTDCASLAKIFHEQVHTHVCFSVQVGPNPSRPFEIVLSLHTHLNPNATSLFLLLSICSPSFVLCVSVWFSRTSTAKPYCC